jgi:hypothetical protein
MKTASYISVITIANLLLANVTASVLAAGQGKNPHTQRGAIFTNGNSKQTADHNAQWSADPDRGWVRSDEGPSRRSRDNSSATPKQIDGKNKGNGKARKRF